jgi:hypothetical protein
MREDQADTRSGSGGALRKPLRVRRLPFDASALSNADCCFPQVRNWGPPLYEDPDYIERMTERSRMHFLQDAIAVIKAWQAKRTREIAGGERTLSKPGSIEAREPSLKETYALGPEHESAYHPGYRGQQEKELPTEEDSSPATSLLTPNKSDPAPLGTPSRAEEWLVLDCSRQDPGYRGWGSESQSLLPEKEESTSRDSE